MHKSIKPIGKTAEYSDELLKLKWQYERTPPQE